MAKKEVDAIYDQMGQLASTKKGAAHPEAISQLVPDVPKEANPSEEAPTLSKDQLAQMLKEFAATDEGKATLNIRPDKQTEVETYRRDYANEAALRVTGGLEVEHAPDFKGDPPEYIKKFEAVGGGLTDYEEGLMHLDEDGHEVQVRSAARRGLDGKPVLSPGYIQFLFVRKQGGRLDGRVRSDIAHNKFVPDDEGVAV